MIVPSRSKESSLRYAFYTDGPWVSGQSPCLQRPPKANIAFWALFDMVMLEVRLWDYPIADDTLYSRQVAGAHAEEALEVGQYRQ